MFSFTGKKALITGATGGIGAAIAKTLKAQGATVYLSGTREEALKELKNELGGSGVEYFTCNLSNKQEVSEFFDKVDEAAGGVDILVCNAGITKDNLVLRMKEEDWQQVIDINLTATFVLNKAAFKRMMKRRYGRIINIASVVAVSGNPGQTNYVASKAGMIGMSKALAQECASRGITVNCIAPGFIKTKMTDILTDEQKSAMIASIPMGTFGLPEDVATAVAYLASEEARYVTGQTLHVNGGMLMV